MDINPRNSYKFHENNPGAIFINADALLRRGFLPFADKQFNKINIVLPLGGLLHALTRPNEYPLWPDMKRILMDKGTIEIVVDSPYAGQGYDFDGQEYSVQDPEEIIYATAKSHGFQVFFDRLSAKDLAAYGTDYSKFTSSWLQSDPFLRVYKITAELNPEPVV